MPAYTLAQSGLVPCGTERTPVVDTPEGRKGGEVINPCKIDHVFELINTVINFILFQLALPISAIAFVYAGFRLMFSGGGGEAKTQAKDVFVGVAMGLFFVAASWLIVHLVLSVLGYDGSWIGF